MHQTEGNIICILTHAQPPQNMLQANQIVDSALTTMHTIRCSMHHTLNMSTGAFVYQRDMFLNIPLIANLQTIQDRRQVLLMKTYVDRTSKDALWITLFNKKY
jgi:hypothetical protein